MEKEILLRLTEVEKKYKNLKNIFFGLVALLFIGLFAFTRVEQFNIIRAKGIIIEDSAGRDRILIGAPIPFSRNRVRTDTALVRKHWAAKLTPNNPDKYMGYYKNYYNATEGMVVMNENGFDRVLVGDKLADANTGKRMFEAAGISWNDKNGFELGGGGVNTTNDGKSRAVIGLDNLDGEAIHIVALEDGTNALMIKGNNGALLIGISNKNGQLFQNENEFAGIKYFNGQGKLVWEQKKNEANKPKVIKK
jgi:hypothetical protein